MGIWKDLKKHLKLILPSMQSTIARTSQTQTQLDGKVHSDLKSRLLFKTCGWILWVYYWMNVCVWRFLRLLRFKHTHTKHIQVGGLGNEYYLGKLFPLPWYHSELFKYAWQLWSLSSPQRTTCCSLTPGVKDHLATILVYTDSHILQFHTEGRGHPILPSLM